MYNLLAIIQIFVIKNQHKRKGFQAHIVPIFTNIRECTIYCNLLQIIPIQMFMNV